MQLIKLIIYLAVEDNLILNLNNLFRSLDTYNWAIQLNKIEKENNQDEIIDELNMIIVFVK